MLKYVDDKGVIYNQQSMSAKDKKKNNIVGQYYFIDDIKAAGADWNMVVSARNLGKSVSLGNQIIADYFEKGYISAFVRRYQDQFKDPNMRGIFTDSVNLGALKRPDNKEHWDNIEYRMGGWYLCRYDDELNKTIYNDEPIARGMGLNRSNQNIRGMKDPKLFRIYFDEFVAKGFGDDTYLPDEYSIFVQLINTLNRMKDDFKVYMFGNTQGQMANCPYFEELGIDVDTIAKGKIVKVRNHSEEHEGWLAVEWVLPRDEDMKPSGSKFNYFRRDGKDAQMTENGDWEVRLFPHLPFEYENRDVKKEYYIWWKKYIFRCEIIKKNDKVITFIQEAFKGDTDAAARDMLDRLHKPIIFTPYAEGEKRWFKYLTKPENDFGKFALSFFKSGQVYYDSNMTGETISAYIEYCKRADLIIAK